MSLKREGSVILAVRFLGFGSCSLLKTACSVCIRSEALQHFQAFKCDVHSFYGLLVLLDHLTGLNLLSWWGIVQTKRARWESVVSCMYAGWRNLRAVMVCDLEKAPTLWPTELVQVRNHPRKHWVVPRCLTGALAILFAGYEPLFSTATNPFVSNRSQVDVGEEDGVCWSPAACPAEPVASSETSLSSQY